MDTEVKVHNFGAKTWKLMEFDAWNMQKREYSGESAREEIELHPDKHSDAARWCRKGLENGVSD